MFLCRGRVKKQQLVIKQIPLDELKNVERKAARNEVAISSTDLQLITINVEATLYEPGSKFRECTGGSYAPECRYILTQFKYVYMHA